MATLAEGRKAVACSRPLDPKSTQSHRHAWGLRPHIRSVRSNGAKRPYFNHIEHLAYVPGEHVPQGMWHDFLICYGQNGQDFIDT